jgi:hypothetical protein
MTLDFRELTGRLQQKGSTRNRKYISNSQLISTSEVQRHRSRSESYGRRPGAPRPAPGHWGRVGVRRYFLRGKNGLVRNPSGVDRAARLRGIVVEIRADAPSRRGDVQVITRRVGERTALAGRRLGCCVRSGAFQTGAAIGRRVGDRKICTGDFALTGAGERRECLILGSARAMST